MQHGKPEEALKEGDLPPGGDLVTQRLSVELGVVGGMFYNDDGKENSLFHRKDWFWLVPMKPRYSNGGF